MGKYDPLREHLRHHHPPSWRATFEGVAALGAGRPPTERICLLGEVVQPPEPSGSGGLARRRLEEGQR